MRLPLSVIVSMMSASDRAGGFVNFLILLLQMALGGVALVWLFDVWWPDSSFVIPSDSGGFVAFVASAVSASIGFIVMFAPGTAMRVSGLVAAEGRGRIHAAVRSSGGFLLGAGLVALLHGSLFAELAMGSAYIVSVAGRLITMIADRGRKYFAD